MINKKITSEIAVGVIVLIAIVFGAIFWLQSRKVETGNSKLAVVQKEEMKMASDSLKSGKAQQENISPLNVPSGWKLYKHDVLGIEFIYPATWGEPETKPNATITKLDGVTDEYTDETNSYFDSVEISFSVGEDYKLSFIPPEIKIFGEKYKGEYYPNLNAQQYGYIDNIGQLKSYGSICDYKINFNTAYDGAFDEAWGSCENGVKQALIREKEVFSGETGTLYSYDLKQFGYKKLQNGFFDNALVSQVLGSVSQSKKDNIDIADFAEQAKTGSLFNKKVDNDQLKQRRDEFSKFIASIKSFSPVQYSQGSFEVIPNEDPNITVIRKYYWLISTGKLQDAYNMYSSAKNISLGTYSEQYKNVYFAKPLDFKKISDNQYEFSVQYQENNVKPTEYKVIMNVSSGEIETKSSVEILTKEVTFGDMKANSIRRGDKNYVILVKNGTETIVDQGGAKYSDTYNNIGDVKFFSEIQFSPDGKYLTYKMAGYEWSLGYVYDISSKKIVFKQDSPGDFQFVDNGKYFVSCAASSFAGTFAGFIFNSSNFKTPIFDILNYEKDVSTNYASIECKNDGDVVNIYLNNENWEGVGKDQKPANKTIIYSLSQNKVIK